MTREEDSDLELYGTSPGVIAFFMILISLIVPLGVLPSHAFALLGLGTYGENPMIYSLIWVYIPDFYIPFTVIPSFILVNIWFTLPITIFNIVYVWKIIRYYRGNCSRYSVIWVGLLSITIPIVFTLATTGFLNPTSGVVIIGPIPHQFIAGLIFLFKIPGPEMTSPWRYDLVERSWWIPKRSEWWSRLFPFSEEDKKNEPESESKSEWTESE
ncbi:MAG: hypothetical protein ACTSSE_05605 [Candidatus Thorarchaeota archaeon]